MRFHVGPPPETPIPKDEPWRPIREPGPILVQILALPVALVTLFFLFLLWGLVPVSNVRGEIVGISGLLGALGVGLAVIAFHELLHALVMPGGWWSDRVLIGFWPQRLLFYAHYDGVMSRNRFLAVLLAPFLVLSLGPIGLAWSMTAGGSISSWFLTVSFAVSLFNGLASCGDLLGVMLIGAQVPRKALVRNRGWHTFWRPRRADVEVSPYAR